MPVLYCQRFSLSDEYRIIVQWLWSICCCQPRTWWTNIILYWKINMWVNHSMTWCSQKSSSFPTPTTPDASQEYGSESGFESGSGSEYGMGYSGSSGTDMLGRGASSGSELGSGSGSASASGSGEAMLADGSWLAGLAMGDAAKTVSPPSIILFVVTFIVILSSVFL